MRAQLVGDLGEVAFLRHQGGGQLGITSTMSPAHRQ
jgi:hypothetical protein